MLLKSIIPRNFGPFATETKLVIDPEVTVITGPNDVGKSFALRVLETLLNNGVIKSHEVNRQRFGEFEGNWNEDPEIDCTAIFQASRSWLKANKLENRFPTESTVEVRKKLNQNTAKIECIKKPYSYNNSWFTI